MTTMHLCVRIDVAGLYPRYVTHYPVSSPKNASRFRTRTLFLFAYVFIDKNIDAQLVLAHYAFRRSAITIIRYTIRGELYPKRIVERRRRPWGTFPGWMEL